MKSPALDLFLAFVLLISPGFVRAQRAGSSRGGPPDPNNPSSLPGPESPEESMGRIFLSGTVVVEDGSELPGPAVIQTICNGIKHTETDTNKKGNFSFEFANQVATLKGGQVDEDASSDTNRTPQDRRRDLHECQLQAVLSGFSSETVQIGSRLSGFGSSDIGRIVLRRLSPVEGLTVSATSGLAPPAARKAFEKALQQEKKQAFRDAGLSLEKAVAIYPNYAEAWFELGRLRVWEKDEAGAREAFTRSRLADPVYANPARALSELAMRDKDWPELLKVTGSLLARYPAFFPDVWFRNALANYYLQDFAAAEQSARHGLQLDQAHQIPKLEYLLGLVLIQRHDYPEARTHMQQFLQTATQPGDVADAQKQLAEIARLSGEPGPSPGTSRQ